jgi:hypothetical protein
MILAATTWFLPWYMLGFVLLAFLPRWHWLLAGSALVLSLIIKSFHAPSQHDSGLDEIGDVVIIFLAGGLTSGFLARAMVLVGVARQWTPCRPLVVLPLVFVLGAAISVGYFALGR